VYDGARRTEAAAIGGVTQRLAGGFILLTGIDGTCFAVRQQAIGVIHDADECHDETIVQMHGACGPRPLPAGRSADVVRLIGA
jgi:hypothetical protein